MFKRDESHTSSAPTDSSLDVKSYQPRSFGSGETKSAPPVISPAAVEPEEVHPDHVRFDLHPAVKRSLGIEKEEHRVLEVRIQEEVAKRLVELKEKSYSEGFNFGKTEGEKLAREEFQQKTQPIYDRFTELCSSFDNAKEEVFQANEQFLIELVFQIGKQVLLTELKADPEYIKRLAVSLVKKIGAKDHIKIKIGRADFQQMEAVRDYLKQQFVELKNIQIDVSDDMESGGCKVETDLARINASVETQLQLINQSLGAP